MAKNKNQKRERGLHGSFRSNNRNLIREARWAKKSIYSYKDI